jgi:uroporphyrinogen decarboxylase
MTKEKGRMTDSERVEVLLQRERPDRVPFWPFSAKGFSVIYAKGSVADAYNKPEVCLAAQRKASQDFGWVSTPTFGYAAYGAWEFGGEINWPTGEFAQAPTVARHAAETADDVLNLKVPDVKTAGILPLRMEFYKLACRERPDNEPFSVDLTAGSVFTTAANIAGVERFARWLIKEPDIAHRVLRLATDYLIDQARYWRDTFGIDGVLPRGFEPTASNQMISPKHFEEYVLPYLKEVHQEILAMGYRHIFEHICGEHNANLPYWSLAPFGDPGIISIGHEIELETAARYFPNDIILGNLNPSIIQVGTPDDVYKATAKVIEQGKKCPGGFAFSPGCEMPPKSDPECVRAMSRAIEDFGWYE